jgi:hypothetical protein
VVVTIESRRKLGRALALAKGALTHHNLSNEAVLDR